jgi:hypothetical protein
MGSQRDIEPHLVPISREGMEQLSDRWSEPLEMKLADGELWLRKPAVRIIDETHRWPDGPPELPSGSGGRVSTGRQTEDM